VKSFILTTITVAALGLWFIATVALGLWGFFQITDWWSADGYDAGACQYASVRCREDIPLGWGIAACVGALVSSAAFIAMALTTGEGDSEPSGSASIADPANPASPLNPANPANPTHPIHFT
jgi:hypothetical protein